MKNTGKLRQRRADLRRARDIAERASGPRGEHRVRAAAASHQIAKLDELLADSDGRMAVTDKVAAATTLLAAAIYPSANPLAAECDAITVRGALDKVLEHPDAALYIAAYHLRAAAQQIIDNTGKKPERSWRSKPLPMTQRDAVDIAILRDLVPAHIARAFRGMTDRELRMHLEGE